MARRLGWKTPVIVFAVFTLLGLSKFFHYWLDDLARGHHPPFQVRLIEELTGAYAAALIVLALAWLVGVYPVDRATWTRRVPVYVLATIACGVLHTTMMWASRSWLFPLLGLGPYDYGLLRFRYPMEFAIQAPNLAMILLLLHGWAWYQSRRDQELHASRLETELSRVRPERLEAQLAPHFLFNTLNGISSLMYKDPARADRILGRLADLLRLGVLRPADPEVPLAQELEWLGWYLEIMQLRLGDRLTIRQQVDPATLPLAVPRLVLQPLVENALTHGVARRAGPATVTICAALESGRLVLRVLDDGPGLETEGNGRGHGVGLSNTSERLRTLYAGQARLILEGRLEGGMEARLELPARAAGAATP